MRTRLTLAVLAIGFSLPLIAFADGSQPYASPGTYTFQVPQDSTSITIQMWGGGGGGSGGDAGGWGEGGAGGVGGGGGGYTTETFSTSQLPSSITVTVGGGGAGGAGGPAGSAGQNGGTSSFGSYLSASGGEGGPSSGVDEAYSASGGSYSGGSGENGGTGADGPSTGDADMFASNGGSTSCAGAGGGGGASETEQTDPTSGDYVMIYDTPMSAGSSGCGGSGASGGDLNGDNDSGSAPGGGGGGGMSGSAADQSGTWQIVTDDEGYTANSEPSNWYNQSYAQSGGSGAPGEVVVTWSGSASSPTCSVSFGENPLTDSATTITWNSSGATLFYINNIGYVGASGSATIYSAGDYSGSVSGAGGTGSCAATLGSGSTKTTPPGVCADDSAAPNGDPSQCPCSSNAQCSPGLMCSQTTGECNGGGGGGGGGSCLPGHVNADGSCSVCNIGYTQEGSQCIFVSCPIGYTQTTANGNPECIFNSCPEGYTQGSDANGSPECTQNSCSIGYVCKDGSLYTQDASCSLTFDQACSYGCTGSAGSASCNPPPAPILATWSVAPILLKSGQTTSINWLAQNVASCSIKGSNEDGTAQSSDPTNPGLWSDLTGTKTSSPILGQTTYTITCAALEGATPTSVSSSTVVNVVPTFQEN